VAAEFSSEQSLVFMQRSNKIPAKIKNNYVVYRGKAKNDSEDI
jgi:hypothetical protein